MKKSGLIPAVAIASGLALAGFCSNQSVFAEEIAYGATEETAYGAAEEPILPDGYTGGHLRSITIRTQSAIAEGGVYEIPYLEDEVLPDVGCIGHTGDNLEYEYCPYGNTFTIKNAGTADRPVIIDVSYMGDLKIKIEGKNYFSLRSTNTSIEFIGDGEINCNLSAGLPTCIDIEDFDSEFDDTTGVKKAVFSGNITYNFIAGTENAYNGEGILVVGTDVEINGGIFNIKNASSGFTMFGSNGVGEIAINGGELNIEDSTSYALLAMNTNTNKAIIKLGKDIKSREENIELLTIKYETDEVEAKEVITLFVDKTKVIDCNSIEAGGLFMPNLHLGTKYTNEIKQSGRTFIIKGSLETDEEICIVQDMNDDKPQKQEEDKKDDKEEDKGGIGTPKTGLFEKEDSLATVPMILAGISMLIVSALVARKIKKSHKKFEYKF